MREIYIQYYTSPCGELILASIGNELCLCDWNGMSCAERNKRRISKYLNVEFRTGSSSVIEKKRRSLTTILPASAKCSTFRCVLSELISNFRYGNHCSTSHTEKQEAIWILPGLSATQRG